MSIPPISTRSGRALGTHSSGTSSIPEGTALPEDLADQRTPIDNGNVAGEPNLAEQPLPPPELDAPIDSLTFQQQMMAMMNLLTQSIAGQRRATSPVPVRAQEPKVKDPETFHGKRESLNSFITECSLVFELQPSRFTEDRVKVSYMISLLRDTPLMAIRPLLSIVPRPLVIDNYYLFVDYLQTNYGDPDERGTARRKLKALRQTGPASAYFAEFQQYIAILGWRDQDPIIDKAVEGLKPYLKDEIARAGHQPVTLTELIAFIVPLDNRLFERERERKNETRTTTTTVTSRSQNLPSGIPTSTTTTISSGPAPNNNVTRQFSPSNNYTRPSGNPPRGPLSEEEKQRRRDHNLCLQCAAPGHIAVNCPGGRSNIVPVAQVKVETTPTNQGNDQGSPR
jgi:hypothetical protein